MKLPGIDTDRPSLDDLAEAGQTESVEKFTDTLKDVLRHINLLRSKVEIDEVDVDDATQLMMEVTAVMKPGSKAVMARQPLPLGPPTSNGGVQRAVPDGPVAQIVQNIAHSLDGKSEQEAMAILDVIDRAIHGDFKDVPKLRGEIREYKDVINALNAVNKNDKPEAMLRAIDAITNTTTVTGISQATHDRVKKELDDAIKQRDTAVKERDALKNNPTLVGKLKGAFKWHGLIRKFVLDESKLDEADLKALALEKK